MKKARVFNEKNGGFWWKKRWVFDENSGGFRWKNAGFWWKNKSFRWKKRGFLMKKKRGVFDENNEGFSMKKTGVFDEKRGVFDQKSGDFRWKSDVTACPVLELTQWNIPGPKSLWRSLRVSREVWVWNMPVCKLLKWSIHKACVQLVHKENRVATQTVEYSRPKPLWEPLRTPKETLGLEYSIVWVPHVGMYIIMWVCKKRGVLIEKQGLSMKKLCLFDEKTWGFWWKKRGVFDQKTGFFDEKNVGFFMKKRGVFWWKNRVFRDEKTWGFWWR